MPPAEIDALRRENEELKVRLDEAEAAVRAIRKNEVDTVAVERPGEESDVFFLDGVEAPYRLLTEQMHQGAVILSDDGAVIYGNRRLADMLLVPSASLRGTQLGSYIVPEYIEAFSALIKGGIGGDAEGEIHLQRSDGKILPTLFNASPFVQPSHIVCLIITDLSQQKSQEAERQRLVKEQLARAAAEKVAEVLRIADRRKDEFLAMLGHELRNPLAPLRNGLEILNQLGAKEDVTMQQTRAMMGRQLESLIRLVDDLLDVSRVTQGKIKLQMERGDLKTIVLRAVESCRTLLETRGHHLKLNLPEESVPIHVDVVRANQFIVNLLHNAAKFTADGGIIWLTLEIDADTNFALVRVRDNGSGIDPESLPTIFDLFAQADPSVSRSEGGLGIGLTLARRLVELHGGILEAHSEGLGRGSEFVIRLPVSEPATASHADTSGRAARTDAATQLRILVVDDNRDSANTMSYLLRLLGHEVREAYDGPQALEVIPEFRPDILLLDIGLPSIDGYEVARQIRLQPQFQQTRLVALSGYGSDADRRRSQASGFDDHLVKPVDFAALQSVLAHSTGKSHVYKS